jgi:hypothetical protein
MVDVYIPPVILKVFERQAPMAVLGAGFAA